MRRSSPLLTQLCFFSVVVCCLLFLVAIINLSFLRDNMLAERKSRLISIVEKTETIFQTYDAYYRSGQLTLAKAQSQALARISSLDDNYIFVFNDAYTLLASREDNSAINKNVRYYKDILGSYIYQDVRNEILLNPEGQFFSYYFPAVEGGKALRKISYSKYFTPWGWTYGLGIYLDDIDDVISTTLISFDELVI